MKSLESQERGNALLTKVPTSRWVGQSLLFFLSGFSLLTCQPVTEKMFSLLPSNQTNVHFNNLLDENKEQNVYTYMNIYTGAGVAAGDINNDGLVDLFFSGGQVASRIYLNKGGLVFEDITQSSGIKNVTWATGAVLADVNQDGWQDIYVCTSGNASDRRNLLFINNGDKTFTESAAKFGVADTRRAMHASFFDYDRDGDLDLFIITNPASFESEVNHIRPRKLKGESESSDILYRNNGDNTFTDISKEAGILVEGYSLGLAIVDINKDLWPDIYISNDFAGNDILYINNQNGTFTNQAATFFRHTSFAGMGNDAGDINNDGLVDIVELDMRPEDNKRLKSITPPTGYDKYQLSLQMGYEPQFSRNTLQLNQGNNRFSEISFLSGISSTDWSWSPLLADYDNDGDKDLFVTNGFLRDIGNMDFIAYQTSIGTTESKIEKVKKLEGLSLRNYLFENKGNLIFMDRSESWGMDKKGFSYGAAYADLDNDGDLDLVVNNMNDEARVYRNNCNAIHQRNYLRLKFKGSEKNRDGIGAGVTVYDHSRKQFFEHFLNRGYESTVDAVLHVGLDTTTVVDSLEVTWPDGKTQVIESIKTNQLLVVDYKDAKVRDRFIKREEPKLFTSIDQANIDYTHEENEFVDFKIQPLLPHMHSKNGPGIAVSDVNGDGLDDFFIGGAANHSGVLFTQQPNGKFKRSSSLKIDSRADELGVLFFDADNDGDDDLYVVTGGTEIAKESVDYVDYLYLNDGRGKFSDAKHAIPDIRQSGSCVVASDYDHDGDLDLFVGGRITPGEYPMPPNSYLLRNDFDGKNVRFTDVTQQIIPSLNKLGLVTSALWTDMDNDGWLDLLIVGEFMPITFLRNENGRKFDKVLAASLENSRGWWNSLTAGDFDRDGDTDYVVGNLGTNSRYHGSTKQPLCVYAKDFDKNGSIDPVMTYYLQGEKQIVHLRDELISQISMMKLRYNNYKDYAEATFEKTFLKSEMEDAYIVCAEWFETSYLENKGNGIFNLKKLPVESQFAPIYGMVTKDFNKDGFLDILMAGNFYANEVSSGQYDASIGLYLQGDGHGNFQPLGGLDTGFYLDGDAKGMVSLKAANGDALLLIGNNSGPVRIFVAKDKPGIQIEKEDVYALVKLKNGGSYKQEFYYGSSYLSQSTRKLEVPDDAVSIKIANREDVIRLLKAPFEK